MTTYDRVREYIRETIDVAVRSGYGTEDDIIDQVTEQIRDEFRDEDEAAIEAEIQRFMPELQAGFATQRAAEATWNERTHNDRIDAAFDALAARGVVALQDAGYTMSDGWDDIAVARDETAGAWGGVFFHRQDVERGVDGGGLMLAFGAFADGDEHEPESLRLARETCEVLAEHGVETDWNGSIDSRIGIPGFPWRRRRYTTYSSR